MHLPKYCIVEGRRLGGLRFPDRSTPCVSVLGDYFARAAYLDAASAVAFARLRFELASYGAPEALVRGCEHARLAELAHTRALGRLAERHGVRPMTPKARTLQVRPLADVAIDNIVEGFVRQTYGAAVARFRARGAADVEVRRVMETIAADECVHAELAFDISTWLQSAIDPVEGVWVENAMRHEVVALARELDVDVDPELARRVGVPSRRDALAIWSGLSHRVWHGIADHLFIAAAA